MELTTAAGIPDLVDLIELGDDRFTAPNEPRDERWPRLFGGQVLAQAIAAAARTIAPDRRPHSCHAYFLRPGDPDVPVVLSVVRNRDGGSFSARNVAASQGGSDIFIMSTSFQRPEAGGGLDAPARPGVPAPDAGLVVRDGRDRAVELIVLSPADPPGAPRSGPPARMWARATGPLGDDPLLHACALAYISDIGIGFGDRDLPGVARNGPSIDHALWFQHPVAADDWVLMDLEPWKAAGGRGLYTGAIHDRSGRLAATLAQEALVRVP